MAVDYPGFGLSVARPGFQYTAEEQATVVKEFVERLGLWDLTLMMWEWGGPIGLSAAIASPDRYRAFVVANTWAWPAPARSREERFSKVASNPIVLRAARKAPAVVDLALLATHRRRRRLAARVGRMSFSTIASRERIVGFAAEVFAARPFLRDLERKLPLLADYPALIVWRTKDLAFGEQARARFEQVFPRHMTVDIAGAGHHFMDDAPDDVVAAVIAWRSTVFRL